MSVALSTQQVNAQAGNVYYCTSSSSAASTASSVASSTASSVASSTASSAGSAGSSSSFSPPAGSDFFVYDIRLMTQITLLGSVNTQGGVQDLSLSQPGKVAVASPRADQALTIVNVATPSAPVVERTYSMTPHPGTAVGMVDTLTILGLQSTTTPSTTDLLSLLPSSPGQLPDGTHYDVPPTAYIDRARVDPTGCYAFMALTNPTKQLSIARIRPPTAGTIMQTWNDGIGIRGTSVLYDPWTDHLLLTSNGALTVLGPSIPGDGTCQ
jgi:hypothetical protein